MEAIRQIEPVDPIEKIKALAQARADYEATKKLIDDAREAVLAKLLIDHSGLYADLDSLSVDKLALEEEVRALGLTAYQADNADKHPYPGVDIAVSKTPPVTYPMGEALDWCKEHDMFLQVNIPEFDAFCLTSAKPDFAELGQPKVTAKLATDLPKALAKAGIEFAIPAGDREEIESIPGADR